MEPGEMATGHLWNEAGGIETGINAAGDSNGQ
jgi:hypothetical protein